MSVGLQRKISKTRAAASRRTKTTLRDVIQYAAALRGRKLRRIVEPSARAALPVQRYCRRAFPPLKEDVLTAGDRNPIKHEISMQEPRRAPAQLSSGYQIRQEGVSHCSAVGSSVGSNSYCRFWSREGGGVLLWKNQLSQWLRRARD